MDFCSLISVFRKLGRSGGDSYLVRISVQCLSLSCITPTRKPISLTF
jgi:hypothetical protein